MADPILIQLPPQPAPIALTAQARPQTLVEHLQAFLAANNLRGFVEELTAVTDPSSIAGQLQQLLEQDQVHRDTLRTTAKTIKRSIGKGGPSHCQWLEIIAAIMGYRSWSAIHARADDMVPNMGNAQMAQVRIFAADRAPSVRQAKRAVLRPRIDSRDTRGGVHG